MFEKEQFLILLQNLLKFLFFDNKVNLIYDIKKFKYKDFINGQIINFYSVKV